MGRRRRRWLWALGVPVVLVVAALVVLRIVFPDERVRELAAARLGERLGREVTIAEAGLSLRGGLGIELRDVAIADPPGTGGGHVLTAGGLDLKLRLGPLLRREVRVDRLVVREPRATLWRRADGSDNFTFADTTAAAGPDTAAGAEGAAAPAGDSGGLAVSIERMQVVGGAVAWRDEAAELALRVAGLELDADLVDQEGGYRSRGRVAADSVLVEGPAAVPPLDAALTFDLAFDPTAGSVTLHDGEVRVLGIQGALTGRGDAAGAEGRLTVAPTPLADVLSLLPAEVTAPLAETTLDGRLSADLDLAWNADGAEPLLYSGRATLSDLEATYADVDAALTAAAVHADLARDRADVSVEAARLAGAPLTAALTVRDFAAPRWEGRIAGTVDLGLAASWLPPQEGIELGGTATCDVEAKGTAADPGATTVTGTLDVQGARFAAARLPSPLTRLDAELVLEPAAVELTSCRAVFAAADVELTGRLTHPRSFLPATDGPRPRLTFTARSGRCDVDRLFPAAAPAADAPPGADAPRPGAPPPGGDTGPPPRLPDLVADGTFAADTLLYSRVAFTGVRGRARYEDRTLRCDPVTARVYSGRAEGDLAIDLTDLAAPRYAGTFEATDVEADDFVSRFSPLEGIVFGRASLEGRFAASGREPERIRETLDLDARAGIAEGRLVVGETVRSSLGELGDRLGGGLDREYAVRDLATALHVVQGRVHLERLRTRLGELGDLTLDGSYGFGGDLDYDGGILLSATTTRHLLRQSGVLGDLLGDGAPERLELPLTVGGTLTAPAVKLDLSTLTEELGRSVADEAKDELGDWLKKRLGK